MQVKYKVCHLCKEASCGQFVCIKRNKQCPLTCLYRENSYQGRCTIAKTQYDRLDMSPDCPLRTGIEQHRDHVWTGNSHLCSFTCQFNQAGVCMHKKPRSCTRAKQAKAAGYKAWRLARQQNNSCVYACRFQIRGSCTLIAYAKKYNKPIEAFMDGVPIGCQYVKHSSTPA